ncbi:MAG: mechanosensitive ion channel family protein [Dysgonamonadaceae bacterium]|jgi:small-conductance mechanosensitive channel|nr:mechanosensitive ion channel family protein [Dysgonamonadaceae bacterium]
MKPLVFYFLFSTFGATILCAQSPDNLTANSPVIADSTLAATPEYTPSPDSSQLKLLQEQLQESKLNEMNLRMEMEQLKLAAYAADSLKTAEQKARIDSLRNITEGIPVVIEADTLFFIYTNKGGLSPAGRAALIESAILRLGKEYDLKPDSVSLLTEETFTDMVYKGKVIGSITDKDAMWMNTSREKLSEEYRRKVVSALEVLKHKYGLSQLIKHLLLFILVVSAQYVLIRFTNYFYKKLKIKIENIKQSFLKPFFIKNYEFLSIDRQERLLFVLLNVARYIFIFVQLIFSVLIIFSIFPQTEALALQLFSYILNPLKKIGLNFVRYIPNIFTILIIWMIIKYIIKGIKYLADEIAGERLKVTGFYPDWAKPTYNIIRFLLYAFMIVLIYPYLPNSQSKVFQGVSVFLGLIVSFGSSSAIGNLVAGMIITYMRSFKINDRIKINNIVGNVIEKTPIVTRILTIKNEIVTIPNSTIMSSQITNLSESARTHGLTLYLNVTCGYETPWRTVHQLLLDAADATPDVMKTPHPYVLEDGFDDFNVVYQINIFISDANKATRISSDLRQNIQDKFNEAGISILSPHYYVNVGEG